MEIDEFEKQVAPAAKRSKLTPYKVAIFELKEKGYANGQIAEFLEINGLKVTAEAVRKFIKSNEVKTGRRSTDRNSVGAGPEVGTPAPNPRGEEHHPVPENQGKPKSLAKPAPLVGQKPLDAKAIFGDLAKPDGPGFSPLPNPSNQEIDEEEKGKK